MRPSLSTRGAILLNGVLLFAAIIIAGLVTFQAINMIQYRAVDQKAGVLQARLWAESGLADATNRVRHDPFWRADGTESFPILQKEIGDGRYRVSATQRLVPNGISIQAEGEEGNFRRRVSQEIVLNIPTLFSIIASEDVRLSDRSLIEGSISAGQNVVASGSSQITGAVQVSGHFNGPSTSIGGPIYEKFPQTIFSDVDLGSYFSLKGVRLFGMVSNLAFEDTSVHISGSAEVTGLSITNGTLVVEGDLRISGPCRIEGAGGRIAVVVTGNLIIEDRGSFSLRGPCYVGRTFRCSGSGAVEGTIIAQNVEISSDFHVRPQLEAAYAPIEGLPRNVLKGKYQELPS